MISPCASFHHRLLKVTKVGILWWSFYIEDGGVSMKVLAWLSQGMFPLGAQEQDGLCAISLLGEDGQPCERVLLSGVSGTGKTTVLEGIAAVWAAAEAWLSGGDPELPRGQVALLLSGIAGETILFICAQDGAFWDTAVARHPQVPALGWCGRQARGRKEDVGAALCARWRQEAESLPNVLHIEEYTLPDSDRQGTEEALRALRQVAPERADAVLSGARALLYGKAIEATDTGLCVRLERGGSHALSALSAGERRILHLLVAIARDLHPGGVLLVDEPEAHLHPSQALGLLTTLEMLVLPDDGQLVLTSHTPEVWRRYENLGVNVVLEGGA